VIGIFKQKNPANILLLLLFGVSIKVPMFLNPHVMNIHEEDSILYKAILNFLEPHGKNFSAVYPLIAFGLLFFAGYYANPFHQ
jgi:hypothetical protein